MLLARDGHDVTVLERDPAPVPDTLDDAWAAWERGGVAQFRQAALPPGRAAGTSSTRRCPTSATRSPPPARPSSTRSTSCRRRSPTARRARATSASPRSPRRRPTLEWVFARAAAGRARRRRPPRRRGRGARDAVARRHAARHRRAHRRAARRSRGDLVVDAMGRRSQLPRLLADAGAAPAARGGRGLRASSTTRASSAPATAARRPSTAPRRSRRCRSFSVLTLPGDNDTWSVTLYIASGDRALKALRHERAWDAVLAACPRHAHWADGEPLTGVLRDGRGRRPPPPDGRRRPAGRDRRGRARPTRGRARTRRSAAASRSGCCTPARLRDVVRYHLEHPRRDRRGVGRGDRGRADAVVPTRPSPRTAPGAPALEADRAGAAAARAAGRRLAPSSRRCRSRARSTPTCSARTSRSARASTLPEEVVARPGLAERVRELAAAAGPPPPGAPDRAEVLALL